MEKKQLTLEDYTVGWVCALPKELTAASALLDEEHEDLALPSTDYNTYYLGRIGVHNVVIAGLPKGEIGTNSAATVATRMVSTFKSIRFGLLVGIGGGVPSKLHDIRLGDVVVSTPTGQHGGVIQWDFGKTGKDAAFERIGSLNRPPAVLMTAIGKLESIHNKQGSKIETYLSEMASNYPKLRKKYAARPSSADVLFAFDYEHDNDDAKCDECDLTRAIKRDDRDEGEEILVHYGLIASGNQVMKHGASRDQISSSLGGVLCFEMEAAGLLNDFPCLVVRGICDYADSHKNKQWQEYAAATAAAFAKELLDVIPANQVAATRTADEAMNTAVQLLIANQNMREDEKKNGEIVKLFHTSDYEAHKERNPHRLMGTCRWFLNHSNFLEWQNSPKSTFLWVSADPGCGKSVLCRSLIDNELKRTTCYFFFKDDNENQQSLIKAMCALIHQLVSQKSDLIEDLVHEMAKKDPAKVLTSSSTLWNLFIKVASEPSAGEVICIFDALDECAQSDKRELIERIKEFYENSSRGSHMIKFLITSRPEPEIERGFGGWIKRFPHIHLAGEEEHESISKEINIVIKAKVKEVAADLDLDDSASSSLEQEMLKMSNRTYLWLKLILELLYVSEDATTETRVRRIVGTIPPTLDTAYEEILRRSRNKTLAKRLLYIVVSAKRPLSLAEMNVALAIKTSSRSYEDLDLEPERIFKKRLRNACGLFVSVVDSRVYLIHQTAREFLVQTMIENQPPNELTWKHSLTDPDSNSILAKACITYLAFEVFEKEASMTMKALEEPDDRAISNSIAKLTAKHVFLDYSATYWFDHFDSATADDTLPAVALNIIDTTSDAFLAWFHIFQHVSMREVRRRNPTALMIAALCGSARLLKLLIDRGADITVRDTEGKITLDWLMEGMWGEARSHYRATTGDYSRRRLSALFCLLRKASANVVLKESSQSNAPAELQALDDPKQMGLSRRGPPCDLLLMRRLTTLQDLAAKQVTKELASISAETSISQSREIRLGAEICCAIVARRILNAIENPYVSTLSTLVEDVFGHSLDVDEALNVMPRDITKVLPDMLATATRHVIGKLEELKDKLSLTSTGLQYAAEVGFELVGSLLLREGVARALFEATGMDLTGVMKILLASGANPDAINRDKGGDDDWMDHTLLSAAIFSGQIRPLEILLSYGGDPNLPLRSYCRSTGEIEMDLAPTAMVQIFESGDMMRCLLDYGADPNRISNGFTPLQSAAMDGCTSIVQVLLEKGVEWSSRVGRTENHHDFEGETALHLAVKEKHSEIVEMLVKHGVDVNITNSEGKTALEIAEANGDTKIVEILKGVKGLQVS